MTAILETRTDVTVNASELLNILTKVSAFASTDRTIPMLNAVRLEASDGVLIAMATDRYVAAIMTLPYEGNGSFVFHASLADVKTLLAIVKRTDRYATSPVALSVSDGYPATLHVKTYDGTSTFRDETADFPKLRAIVPDARKDSPIDAIAVDPKLLARFSKVATKDNQPLRLHFTGSLKPIRLEIGTDFVGLIMPMRVASV
jgi:DNA polymerase III sliding clamp (beta) subunit (PCNA family)